MKNGMMKFAKELREVAKEEIPEWQKTFHEMDMTEAKKTRTTLSSTKRILKATAIVSKS